MIWLHLKWLYWRWMHVRARAFRFELERIIAAERRRAQDAIEQAELEERRAEIECGIRQAR